MWCTAEKRFVWHVCLRNLFPPVFLGIPGFHFLPEAGSWEWQNARSALHYGCKRSHPFVAAAGKTCLMQRSRWFGHGVVVTKICYNAVIVLSVVLCDSDGCEPTNNGRNWVFGDNGLAVGLPAFQLPMFAKCDALPKGDLLDMSHRQNALWRNTCVADNYVR